MGMTFGRLFVEGASGYSRSQNHVLALNFVLLTQTIRIDDECEILSAKQAVLALNCAICFTRAYEGLLIMIGVKDFPTAAPRMGLWR